MLTEEQTRALAIILAPTIEQIIAVAPQIVALLVTAQTTEKGKLN